jgi:hypothetical protein
VPCHVFMRADWKTAWGCGSGCRDTLIGWRQMSDWMPWARRLAAGPTSGQRRSTARRSDRMRGKGCCGAKQMRQPWPAPGGLQRLADHGGRCRPCITSRPRQLERSTDHTGRSSLSQCGQHTHSTASVVSVSAGGSGGDVAAASGRRDRQRATYPARCLLPQPP